MEERRKQMEMAQKLITMVRSAYAASGMAVTCETPSYHEDMVVMRDGIRLKTYWYLPEDGGTYPVIFQRGCYPAMDIINKPTGEELAKRGFAYVYQYCRGIGGSEGVWEPNKNERSDGADALDWLIKQPWAGNIGMYGSSYLAMAGWAVADIAPGQVKSMYLSNYGVDRFSSIYKEGLPRPDILTGWGMQNAGAEIKADYIQSCLFRPHIDVDEKLWGVHLDWYRDMILNCDRNMPYWKQGLWKEFSDIPTRVTIPLFISDSWFDHHLGSALYAYEHFSPASKAHSTLMIGAWNHMMQPCLEDRKPAHIICSEAALMLDWFDRTLRKEELPDAHIRTYRIEDDRWHDWTQWPVPADEVRTLYFNAAHTLTDQPTEGSVSYRYDPENPVPSHGAEAMLTTMKEVGSLRQPEPDWRPDVISFISEPFAEDADITGKIGLTLYVSTDAEDTAFTAKIIEIKPDGKAYNLRSTIATIAAQHEDYTPSDTVPLLLDFWPVDWKLGAGSRLRVDISSSDFPQYGVHTNFKGPWALQGETRSAVQTICMGGNSASCVTLPLKKD